MIIKEKVKNIRAGINKVVVRLNELNDSIELKSGLKLFLETKYEPANHVQIIGTVVGLPSRLYFNEKDLQRTMPHETTMDLKPNDTVYIDYFAVIQALADKYDIAAAYPDPKWFEINGSLHVVVDYHNIYFALRNNQIIPLNGYCIARDIIVEEKADIDLPEYTKHHKSGKWAEIIIPGKPCTAFVDKQYKDKGEINSGDIVLFGSWSNERVEYSLHQTLFKSDGEYVVIQRKWIKAKLPNKYKELVENGKLK